MHTDNGGVKTWREEGSGKEDVNGGKKGETLVILSTIKINGEKCATRKKKKTTGNTR